MLETEKLELIEKYDIIFKEILSIQTKEDLTVDWFLNMRELLKNSLMDVNSMKEFHESFKDRYTMNKFNNRVILSLVLGNMQDINLIESYIHYYTDNDKYEEVVKMVGDYFERVHDILKIPNSNSYLGYVENYIIYNIDSYYVPTLEEAKKHIDSMECVIDKLKDINKNNKIKK